MRVVIVSDYAHPYGGGAKVALLEALGLAEAGHEVHFFAAVGPVDDRLTRAGVAVHCLGGFDLLADPRRFRAARRGLWNIPAARAFAELLAGLDRRETIVHVHGWTKALSASVLRQCLTSRFHLVLSMHDYFLACPNGGLFDYRRLRPCSCRAGSLKCMLTPCDARRMAHKCWRVLRLLLQQRWAGVPGQVRHFIALTATSLEFLRPHLPPAAKIRVVGNPVDFPRAERVPVAVNSKALFVGRVSREKGVDLFAGALRALGVRGTIVGDGPEGAELRRRFPDHEWRGWLDRSGVRASLEEARVLVFPSLWYEVQPLIVLEALSMGIPVIAADRSAAREAIVEGETGLLFQSGNLTDLAEKTGRLLHDAGLAERLGKQAYEQFWSRPRGLAAHIRDLEAYFADLLSDTVPL